MAAIAPPIVPAAPTGGVRWLLRIEGLAVLIAATAAYAHLGFGWGWFAAFFLAPDLTFAAYRLGPRWGAAAYNAAHSTVGPLALGGAAVALGAPPLMMAALIGLAHAGFDRSLGYGLKYGTGFAETHLGRLGSGQARPGALPPTLPIWDPAGDPCPQRGPKWGEWGAEPLALPAPAKALPAAPHPPPAPAPAPAASPFPPPPAAPRA